MERGAYLYIKPLMQSLCIYTQPIFTSYLLHASTFMQI